MCGSCEKGGSPQAALWWRVSTNAQEDLSPETQQRFIIEKLHDEGYVLAGDGSLGAVWSSEEILDCPEMQRLIELIQSGTIHALGVYDLDRLASRPTDRLFLRGLCEKNHVKVLPCYGEIHEGTVGEFLDFAYTWAKHEQVLRAQRSSRDGLRSRAKDKGLMPSGKPPFGYEYPKIINSRGESEKDCSRMVASSDWPLLRRLWESYLSGKSIHSIVKDLKQEGIPSPRGNPQWDPSSIANMLKNPIYAGRPYGLRYRVVQPKKRSGQTYGKSSMADTPFEEWVPLNVKVEPPVVTWSQYQEVQERLHLNQKFSPRNAKHHYLLRGLVKCDVHDKVYHGRHHKKDHPDEFVYVCSSWKTGLNNPTPCKRFIYGATLDRVVWEKASQVLTNPEVILGELERRRQAQNSTEESVLDTLIKVDKKLEANVRAETRLVDLYVRGEISPDIYPRSQATLKAERTWCQEEKDRLLTQLEAVRRDFVTLEQVVALRERLGEKLTSADYGDQRFVLEALETNIVVSTKGTVRVEFAIPEHDNFVLTTPRGCRPSTSSVWRTPQFRNPGKGSEPPCATAAASSPCGGSP